MALAGQNEMMMEMRSGYDSHKATTVMGQALARMRDQILGGFAVRRAEYSSSRRRNEWCLEPVEPRN